MNKKRGLPYQLYKYIVSEKKVWLLPLIVIFALFFILIIIAESVPLLSPFVYTLL